MAERDTKESSTFKKNTEANTRVCDLNQKTMQALDVLAEENEIFQVTHETEDGDKLSAVAYEAMEEFDKAQKDRDGLQDELEATCGSMVAASKEHTNCWENLNAPSGRFSTAEYFTWQHAPI